MPDLVRSANPRYKRAVGGSFLFFTGGNVAQSERFDLCVIGAGAAGLAAARAGLDRGASVAIVEASKMGGVTLNWGAVPAHALAAAAQRAHEMRTARVLGVGSEEPRVNFARINTHVQQTIARGAPEVSAEQLAALGAVVIRDRAAFMDKHTIKAGERIIRARGFIVATGSRPTIPDVPGVDDVPFHTPETIFEITRRPQHLIVVGAGATGTMLAQAHLRLGTAVTLIDIVRPLAKLDDEFADLVLRRLEAEGMTVLANTGLVSIKGEGEEIAVEVKTGADERTLSGSHLLLATGRRANVDGLGLEKAAVRFVAGQPILDRHQRTTNRRLYCVGDAAGGHAAHSASHFGAAAARHALGAWEGLQDRSILPRVMFTDPEIATVGLTEAEARRKYKDGFSVTRMGWSQLDRARVEGRTEGHAKMLTLGNGRIIGVSLTGIGASEVIGIFALAISRRLGVTDLAQTIAPYPSAAQIVPLLTAQYLRDNPTARRNWRHALKRLLP